jgi:exosortase
MKKGLFLFLILVLGSFGFLYRDVIAKLVHDWSIDENYSHGFLVAPLALYFAWERRHEFWKSKERPSVWGLLVVCCSLSLLVVGVLGAEIFTTEVSMIGTLAGSLLFLYGWNHLKVMLFPLLFLLLMVPLPAIIFNQIALPLQFIASGFAETALAVFNIPVLREGNVIHLSNISLEVEEACSGIRSLISLLTLGIVYGYFTDSRRWMRVLIALATVPVAILANGFRVAGTGAAAYYVGPQMAEGFLHAFSGWFVFLAACIMLLLVHGLASRFAAMTDPTYFNRFRKIQPVETVSR